MDNLLFPQGLFIEPKTQILYVADVSNNHVKKRYPNGDIKIAAGSPQGQSGSTADKLNGPKDVFADENENIYIADWSNQRIQYWEKDAKAGKTVAGIGTAGSRLNQFSYPSQVIIDSKNDVIVADLQNQRIMQWLPNYDPKTSAGTIIAVSHSFDFFDRNKTKAIFILGWKW